MHYTGAYQMDIIKQDADIILISGNLLEEFNFNNVK